MPSSLAIITTVFGPGERAAAIGTWTAGTSGAIALGPPLGGLLVDVLSWRVIFALNVPLVLACLWLIRSAVPSIPADGGHRIDVPGAVLCVIGLAGPTYALIQQPLLGWSDPQVWAPLVGGLGALLAFVNYERHAPDPMLPPAIFRSRNFAIGNVVTLSVYAGLGAASFFIAIFLQQVSGYSAFAAGLTLLPITLLMIGLSRRFGALAARTGPRLLMAAGPIVAGLGLLRVHARRRAGRLPHAGAARGARLRPRPGDDRRAADGDRARGRRPPPRRHRLGRQQRDRPRRGAARDRRRRPRRLGAVRDAGRPPDRPPAQRDAATRAYLDEARERPLTVPDRPVAARARVAVREANVAAFHRGMVVSGLLMIAGGLIAAVGNRQPAARRGRAAARPPVAA